MFLIRLKKIVHVLEGKQVPFPCIPRGRVSGNYKCDVRWNASSKSEISLIEYYIEVSEDLINMLEGLAVDTFLYA